MGRGPGWYGCGGGGMNKAKGMRGGVYDSNQINHSRKLSIFLNDAASALTALSPDFHPRWKDSA